MARTTAAVQALSSRMPAVARRAVRRRRILRQPIGSLPDFLVIGAQKAGTSSLYYTLCRHPEILPAAAKEIHYFDLNHELGSWWYRSHFPSLVRRQRHKRATGRVAIGEATPSYLYDPRASERARRLLPEAKLIVLLRDPVSRAYSQYQREVRLGREPLSFAEAVAAEGDRLDGLDAASFAHRHFSYAARGRYAEQLDRWLACFERHQFLFLKSEDFLRDPVRSVHRTVDFLGLTPWEAPAIDQRNVRTYPPIAPGDRAALAETFREPNRRVADLLGFTWEQEPSAPARPTSS